MVPEVESLIRAIATARILLEEHGYTSVPQRLGELEMRLTGGDNDAVISAISEATGSAGSLRDVVLSAADCEAASARLDALVRDVEGAAREAAARLGLHLVR
jgi:tetrahydromethanopterin S-methyltransferase subunit G